MGLFALVNEVAYELLADIEAELMEQHKQRIVIHLWGCMQMLIRQRTDDYPEIKLQLGQLINEINHVGVNINQIVKRNNAGFYDESDKMLLEAYMQKICDEVWEAIEKIETRKFKNKQDN